MDAVRSDSDESNEIRSSEESSEIDEEEGDEGDGDEGSSTNGEVEEEDVAGDDDLRPPLRKTHATASNGDVHQFEAAIAPIDATQIPAPSNPERSQELRSRSPSPDGFSHKFGALSLSDIKTKVTSDLSKTRLQQRRKYHSKRSTRQAGRPQGSKAKQDKKIKLDHGGTWD